ncbi:FecR family protein [Chitinophaga sp. 30R24]|uniref:FecR family protein n=1 Tax=Chitinophaga sp. 30R24 TaxID=3248838 RepID=UPI003B8F6F71
MAAAPLDFPFHIADLIRRHITGGLSAMEQEELDNWIASSPRNQLLFRELTDHQKQRQALEERQAPDVAAYFLKVRIKRQQQQNRQRRARLYYLAAAAIILLVFTAIWHFDAREIRNNKAGTNTGNAYTVDMQPGGKKAQLILAGGHTITLNGNVDTSLLQGAVTIRRGTIAYNNSQEEVQYNTLIVPRGGEYQLHLEDGTNVWMNAASSIRFPSRFTGAYRTVEVTGEAYFEVARKAGTPFRVTVKGTTIEVLGTAFNVHGFPEEQQVYTTLITGAVKVQNGIKAVILRPGKTSISAGNDFIVEDADTALVTAWKNNLFIFKDAPVTVLMKSLERWYDIKVEYSVGFHTDATFTGEISRDVPISKVLGMLEKIGIAKFQIVNNTVIVLP